MRTVLVVDDEWAIAEVLVDLLSDEGYRVLSASNGRDALALIESGQTIDVVLLDYMMPVMDGLETLTAIREMRRTSDVPVILMTSLPEESVRDQAGNYSAFMRKPFLIDDVLAKVADALNR